jgi:hypothetical protein
MSVNNESKRDDSTRLRRYVTDTTLPKQGWVAIFRAAKQL